MALSGKETVYALELLGSSRIKCFVVVFLQLSLFKAVLLDYFGVIDNNNRHCHLLAEKHRFPAKPIFALWIKFVLYTTIALKNIGN